MRIGHLGQLTLEPDATTAFAELVRHLYHGRAGKPWCTWAVAALDGGTFFVADARGHAGLDRFEDVVRATADAFEAACLQQSHPPLFVRASPGRTYPALTVLLRKQVLLEPAEQSLHALRPELLRRGLMMGLLHPRSSLRPLTPGAKGFPYRVSHPFLTVRWAVPGDEVFVGINPTLAGLLAAWFRLGESQRVEKP